MDNNPSEGRNNTLSPNSIRLLRLGGGNENMTELHVEMQRRRMQRLLSASLFICFLILLMDKKHPRFHHNHNRLGGANNQLKTMPLLQNQTNPKIADLQQMLAEEANPLYNNSPLNASGIFLGPWHELSLAAYRQTLMKYLSMSVTHIIPSLQNSFVGKFHHKALTDTTHDGTIFLILDMQPTSEGEGNSDLTDSLAYVKGQVLIRQEQSTFAGILFATNGVFFRKTGKLRLYGNRPQSNVEISFPRQIKNFGNTTVGALQKNASASNMWTYHVSPPMYNPSRRNSRFRNSAASWEDSCFYEMDLQMSIDGYFHKNNASTANVAKTIKNTKRSKVNGVLRSTNCGINMRVSSSFLAQDLSLFFKKASHYALIMGLICVMQVYFILRQLRFSNTQATASKMSLLTVGHQAIFDCYLCLVHLTAGIIAQLIFTEFATVSFFKLIIFSIFEMRYLLLIWKARRPSGFSEGWLSTRRELTTLYSRFYMSLLLGIIIMYGFWNYFNVVVFLGYSYWVPQIVHNVHREVRTPLDPIYLFGISITRLFLPLYLYGCPYNFLEAFPMYNVQTNSMMCYALSLWTLVQVGILFFQQIFGPRFFVPARFLPVKYNYERRIDSQQLSLIRSHDSDAIDCVICMVNLHISARDYMIAPCDHIFHRQCLQEWMDIKMECPTCRCVLPEP